MLTNHYSSPFRVIQIFALRRDGGTEKQTDLRTHPPMESFHQIFGPGTDSSCQVLMFIFGTCVFSLCQVLVSIIGIGVGASAFHLASNLHVGIFWSHIIL